MRVISGSARGRKLKTPDKEDIRPTSDRVKESIFDIIQFDIEGRRVLDLFAGTGQLGIEALSRGAAGVHFIDSNAGCVKLMRENISRCGFEDRAVVCNADALRYLGHGESFDIILIDPPYDTELAIQAVYKIIEFDKLRENGIMIVEMKTGLPVPEINPPYKLEKTYKYGGTALIKITRRV